MSIFVSSTSQAHRHGAYAIERTPPASIVAAGASVVALVGQFPWGPDSATDPIYLASGPADRADTFAPAGMSRTGSGYLSMIKKGFSSLRVIRVLGSAAAYATATLAASGPTTILTVRAKYKGAAGNLLQAVVSAASDGVSNHFNLKVSVTGASGYTEDLIENLDFSDDSALPVIDYSKLRLIGALTFAAEGRPVNATYNFTSGADGTIDAGRYVGTAGTGNYGIAKLEGDHEVSHVIVDDPGNTLRAAVNAGLIAHCIARGDRSCYISGNSGLSAAAVITELANYSSDRCMYVPNWVYQYDESGTLRLIPGTSYAASANSQLSVTTSLAWKNSEVQAMLQGIVSLETDYGDAVADITKAGGCCLIKERRGGHTFESDNTTITRADPARRKNKRRKALDYIARSFVDSTRGSVDAPNVFANRNDLRIAVDNFMSTMKNNQKLDPNHLPHVLNYELQPDSSANDATSIGAGEYHVPLAVDLSPDIEKLFLSVLASITGSVTVQEA